MSEMLHPFSLFCHIFSLYACHYIVVSSYYISKYNFHEKMGWSAMMENLQVLRMSIDGKNQTQGEKLGENMDLKRSFAEVVKKPMCKVISTVQVKVGRKEIQSNLEKLEHCVVGSWNPRFGDEEDLEKLGRFLASSWGLKGSLGLAKLEDSRVLLEFEHLEEAKRASLSGEKRMGAIRLGFEKWSPWDGCREEKEENNEIWVRIFGLPVLLWNPTVLRRVGEECGGFIDIDSKTKKLEELQWARILVRSAGGDKQSTLEIGIEEEVFTLALWWEIRPTVKKLRVDSRRWGRSGTTVAHTPARVWRWNRSVKGPRHWYRQRRGQGDRRGIWAGRGQRIGLISQGPWGIGSVGRIFQA